LILSGSAVFRKVEIKQVQAVISLRLLEEFDGLKFIFDIRNCFSWASLLGILNETTSYVVIHQNAPLSHNVSPIPVAARSKAWVCDRYLAGIVSSNPAQGMDVGLF
jgi:hypothetical protein